VGDGAGVGEGEEGLEIGEAVTFGKIDLFNHVGDS